MSIEREMEIANKLAWAREPVRNSPKIPSHIVPQYNEEFRGWGMYNRRLEAWAGETHEIWGPTLFKTEEQARNWYLEQM